MKGQVYPITRHFKVCSRIPHLLLRTPRLRGQKINDSNFSGITVAILEDVYMVGHIPWEFLKSRWALGVSRRNHL